MKLFKGEKGFSLLELVFAGGVAATAGLASMTAMRNLANANHRTASLNDARAETSAMLGLFTKHFHARWIPGPTDDPDIDMSTDTNPAAIPFGGCGATPVACRNVTFRQRSRVAGKVQTAEFTMGCEPITGMAINYAALKALPGNYLGCTQFQRPFVHLRITTWEDALTSIATDIHFPRGNIGAFMCVRQCDNALSVEAATIYQRSGTDLSLVSNRIALPLSRNTAIQILPP